MENGDIGDIGRNLVILIPIILLVLFNVFRRKRRGEKTETEITFSLLSEIALNQQLTEDALQRGQPKKLRADSWQRNRGKLRFLDQKLQEDLAKTFSMVEEYNRAIDAARKYKSASYLEGISVDRLKESLAHCRPALEEWLQANKDQAAMTPGRRGCLTP